MVGLKIGGTFRREFGRLRSRTVACTLAVRLVDSGAEVGFQVVSVSVLFAFTQLELWTV
jgi:hypothetical protein